MSEHRNDTGAIDRRGFLKTAGAGVAAAGLMLTPRERALAQSLAEKARLERIASNTWPIRVLFKTRQRGGGGAGAAAGAGRGRAAGAPGAAGAPSGRGRGAVRDEGQGAQPPVTAGGVPIPAVPADRDRTTAAEMKAKYGEITMLDFPQWTKDTFPGVTRMDLFSGLFGDVTDDNMFMTAAEGGGGGGGFNPVSPSGRRWLGQLANLLVKTGTTVQHVSNNAPFALADYGSPEADMRRKAGVAMGKRWLEGCAVLGMRSMRMNSTSALGPQIRPNAIPRGGDGYPRNLDIVPLMNAAIESYKEMADFGGDLGIKVTFENHWGLAADPMNLRIMIDTINHPYCEASPDFCNWEHEYMLFNGLKALAPYAHSNAHAKYWDRWGDKNDVQRSVRIMLAGGFKGTFALEYEAGPLNGVEGAKYLYKEVLAALTSPTPVS
jgi:sugar phosphate isomerase/epimerase